MGAWGYLSPVHAHHGVRCHLHQMAPSLLCPTCSSCRTAWCSPSRPRTPSSCTTRSRLFRLAWWPTSTTTRSATWPGNPHALQHCRWWHQLSVVAISDIQQFKMITKLPLIVEALMLHLTCTLLHGIVLNLSDANSKWVGWKKVIDRCCCFFGLGNYCQD